MDHLDTHKTLVLIDDDSVYLRLCQRTIKRSGEIVRVLTFNYAEDALVFFENNSAEKIDLIFLDINMPRMNGFEFLAAATERLKDKFEAKVVIMLTTSLDIEDIEKSKQFPNVKGYVAKPLTYERFKQALELVENADNLSKDGIVIIDTDLAA